MKRRGPAKALVALAAAGVLTLGASAALADTPGNIYTNPEGLSSLTAVPGSSPAAGVAPGRAAGMTLNPGKTGQWLWGTYYDVRPVENPLTGALEGQETNIQILNTNTNNPADPNFDPNGGIVARLRFRESMTSREVLDFDIVLSCAEVWTGKVELLQGATLPRIVSLDPIRQTTFADSFVTAPLLVGGRSFVNPSPSLQPVDIQRGYFEVIAEERVPCEPIDGQVTRAGDTWARLPIAPGSRIPTNTLAAEIILIRVASGVSYIYNAEAISRFVSQAPSLAPNIITPAGGGSVLFSPGTGLPVLSNCFGPDNSLPDPVVPYTGTDNCTNQMNFALSKNRVMAQYDIDGGIGASTRVVFTLPTKHLFCPPGASNFNGVPKAPFSCQSTNTPGVSVGAVGGEQIGCIPYNRLEDFVEGEDIFSPGETSICRLPREMSIVNIAADDSASSLSKNATADEIINVTSIPREHLAGWVDFNLFQDPSVASQLHGQGGFVSPPLNPNLVDLLATGFTGYRGLPVLTLILQEYFNGAAGGVYGGAVPAPYEVDLIKPGQS